MKVDEIKELIRISDEIAKKIFKDYPNMVERQLKACDPARGFQLLQSMIQSESAELDSVRIPNYAEDNNDLEIYLSIQVSDQSAYVIFRPWYESFLKIEKDNTYLHGIIRFEPYLIDDGQFSHERGHYEYGRDPDYGGYPLTATSFYRNVHILVLAYWYLRKNRIAFLERRIREYTNVGNGLHSDLTPEEKRTLFSKLIEKEYIHERTTVEDFEAAMTPEPLPYRFNKNKIKWILTGKKDNPHKTALREFLEMYCKHSQRGAGTAPSQHDIDRVFEDANGNPIKLLRRTKSKPSYYLREMEGFLQ